MTQQTRASSQIAWPTLSRFPAPMKILLTSILCTLALGMSGALGQVIVHDIIPTFLSGEGMVHDSGAQDAAGPPTATVEEGRGDLFGDAPEVSAPSQKKNLLENDQFIWTLRWTHIHLFGMSMIFILLGAVSVFLDLSPRTKGWLIALPFAGVVVDIAAMWLKAFVSPVFFWLHIPGGGLFAGIFVFVFFRAMGEMWGAHHNRSRLSRSN
jgi:hypothetical protein